MVYIKKEWVGSENPLEGDPGSTPITESALDHLETQYDEAVAYTNAQVAGLTKTSVGLGNVDNTSDANKPVSSATQTALNGKANTSHTHTVANVTGLQAGLDAKANTVHGHAIADVTGLQADLDGKASASHTHTIANVTGLQAALDDREFPLVAGANITINRSDPENPVISAAGGSGGAAAWGSIGGTLTNQTDLVTALGQKQNTIANSDGITEGTTNLFLTGAERTKIAGVAAGATANATNAQLRDRTTHTGTQSADTVVDGATNKVFTATEKTKLAGVATGATANQTDATTNAAIALKANAANPVFTGTVTVPDGALSIADTAGLQAALNAKATVIVNPTEGQKTAAADGTIFLYTD